MPETKVLRPGAIFELLITVDNEGVDADITFPPGLVINLDRVGSLGIVFGTAIHAMARRINQDHPDKSIPEIEDLIFNSIEKEYKDVKQTANPLVG